MMDVIDPLLLALHPSGIDMAPEDTPQFQRSFIGSRIQTPIDDLHFQAAEILHDPAYVYETFSHEQHPGCPTSLDCLSPSRGEKPHVTLTILVRAAILGSSQQRLPLREIYRAIEQKFPYFLTAKENWKGSIRHSLSMNPMFSQVPRPATEPGLGAYWTVISDRPLKRRRSTRPVVISSGAIPENSASGPVDHSSVAGSSSIIAIDSVLQEDVNSSPSDSPHGRRREYGRPRGTGQAKDKGTPSSQRIIAPATSSRKRLNAKLTMPAGDAVNDGSTDYTLHGETPGRGVVNLTIRTKGRPRKFTSSAIGRSSDVALGDDKQIEGLILELAETHRQHTLATTHSMHLADQLTDIQADNARDSANFRRMMKKLEEEQHLTIAAETRLAQLNTRIIELQERLSIVPTSNVSDQNILQQLLQPEGEGCTMDHATSTDALLQELFGDDFNDLEGNL